MSDFTCIFCNKNFTSSSNLNTHKKYAKYCLEIQKKELEFQCEFCLKKFNRRDVLNQHLPKCKTKEKFENQNILNEIFETKNTISELKINLEEKDKEINKLKLELMCKHDDISKLEEQNKKLENQLKNILDKAIDKINVTNNSTSTANIINKNQIYNNLEPLTTEYMREQTKFLTYNNVKNGAHGIAHFASNHTFKDRLFCSDKSRLNFVFKNDEDLIVKDPEGVEITKKFIEINREELIRLVNEYLNYINSELMRDIGNDMYKFWASKREEFISIMSAVMKGNVAENKESYKEFKKNFLIALSDLVPR